MQLENAASRYISQHGPPEPLAFICRPAAANPHLAEVDPSSIWDALIPEIEAGSAARAAARFHLGWADIWAQVALKDEGERPIALSGGSFQNQLISNRVADNLKVAGKRVLLHAAVPPNDGGIALGQLAVGLSGMGSCL